MKNRTKILSLFLTVAILIASMVFVFPTAAEEVDETLSETTSENQPAVVAVDLWSNHAANSFANGVRYGTKDYGTKTKPYEISTAAELAYFAWLVNRGAGNSMEEKYFVLTADIDLSAYNWVPIAKSYTSSANSAGTSGGYDFDGDGKTETRQMVFSGVFDGGGHTISGLTFNNNMTTDGKLDATYGGLALFGTLRGKVDSAGRTTVEATVKNLNIVGSAQIENFSVTCSNFGGTVNMVAIAAYQGALIENVNVTANINVSCKNAETNVAGIVGYATKGAIIRNCSVSGSITVDNSTTAVIPCVGGFVSRIGDGAVIDSCVNNADVTAKAYTTYAIAGGFCAKVQAGSVADETVERFEAGTANVAAIVNCVNNGDIYIDNMTGGKGDLSSRAGGFIGNAGRGFKGDALLASCINTGEVKVSNLGGAAGVAVLVGLQETARVEIRNCYSMTEPVCENETEAASITAGFICNAGGGRKTNDRVFYKRDYYTPYDCIFMPSDVVETYAGAALRINPTKMEVASLRFDSKINERFLKTMEDKAITFGTLVIEADVFNEAATGLTDITDIVAKIASSNLRSIPTSEMDVDGSFTAILTNLKEENHVTEYVAISYVTVVIDEETDYAITFYSDYTGHTVSVKSLGAAYYNMRQNTRDGVYAYEVSAEYNQSLGKYSMFSNEQLAILQYYMKAGETVDGEEEEEEEEPEDGELGEIVEGDETPEQDGAQ